MERLQDEQRQGNAVENYARDLNKQANALAQNKQESDEFNSTLEGVLEPVGTAFLHPVAKNIFSKYVKPRLKKALGRGVRGAVRTARQVGTDLQDGVNPLDNLRGNLDRGLSDIRGSVRDIGGEVENALSESGRSVVNNARALAGRSPLTPSSGERDFSDTSQPQAINDDRFNVNTGEPVEESNLYTGGEATETSAFDTGDLTEAQAQASDDIASGRMSVEQALQRYRMKTMEVPRASDQPVDAESQQGRFQARQQQLDQDAQTEARQQPDEPNSTDPNPAQDRQAPASDDSGQEPATPPTEDAPVPPPTEESDLPAVLGTTAEDIEIAGGGPEDIFTDILSGLVGLGSVIAGATIKKPVQNPNMNIANPSVQYGI